MIIFQSLSGSLSSSPSPLSYLLSFDSSLILLDCGCFSSSPPPPSYLSTLKSLAPEIDFLLLSHPTLLSVGLYPWLRIKAGLRCPVYATLPTKEMGRLAVEEWVEERGEEESREETGEGEEEGWKLSSKEVREAFREVLEVKYGQPIHLGKSKTPLTLLALPSGHTIGGSLFTLRSPLSPSPSCSFLYAPIFNHTKGRLIDSTGLIMGKRISERVRRCEVMVVGGENSMVTALGRRERDGGTWDIIKRTLASGNSVLIPSDPSSRVLELLTLLEQMWSYEYGKKSSQAPALCFISRTGKDVTGFARSMTEWMGGTLSGEVDNKEGEGVEGVLKFKHLKLFPTVAMFLNALPPTQPKVIITVPSSLSHGFSRQILTETDFTSFSGNLILLTERPESSTLAHDLWVEWYSSQGGKFKWGESLGKEVVGKGEKEVEVRRKVILQGEELTEYLESKRKEEEKEKKRRVVEERGRRLMEAEEQDSDDEDEDDDEEGSDGEDDAEEGDEEEEAAEEVEEKEETMDIDSTSPFILPQAVAKPTKPILKSMTSSGPPPTQTASNKPLTFDIYLRSDRLRRLDLLRSSMNLYLTGSQIAAVSEHVAAMTRFRGFPVAERKRKVDTYGEVLDAEEWERKGKENAAEEGMEERKEIKMEEGGGKEEIRQEDPHKFVVEKKMVDFKCRIFAINLEGKNDGKALKALLPQIEPKRLIIVYSDLPSAEDLKSSCKSSGMTEEIYVPSVGESVSMGEDVKSFSIRLSDGLLTGLKLSQVSDDYEIALVQGTVIGSDESSLPILEASFQNHLTNSQTSNSMDIDPSSPDIKPRLPTLPPGVLPPLPTETNFIGDMKLTELKSRLTSLRIPAEFAGGGTLICGPLGDEGGVVAVKKGGTGQVLIEGNVGATYYRLREEIYRMHARAG